MGPLCPTTNIRIGHWGKLRETWCEQSETRWDIGLDKIIFYSLGVVKGKKNNADGWQGQKIKQFYNCVEYSCCEWIINVVALAEIWSL